MQTPFRQYLANLSRDFVAAARAATEESIGGARDTADLEVIAEIGGVPLKIEGASNLPSKMFLVRKARMKTEAYLALDNEGEVQVLLQRGLFKTASPVEIELEFERTAPLESLETFRSRANEVNKEHVQEHRIIRAKTLADAAMAMKASIAEPTEPTDPEAQS